MAINYATNYEPMALEAFSLESLTNVFGAKYRWEGAKSVVVFSNETVTPSAYTRSAGYGTPTVIGNTVDTLTVTADVGFSALLDKLDMESTAGSLAAAAWLGTQTRREVIPAIDAYRFDALWDACPTGQISASAAITSANAYTAFLTEQTALDEALVPKAGRVCFATPQYINSLKLDSNYVKASDLAQGQIMFNGQVGMVDGVPIIMTPSTILNATDHHMDFILVHVDAVAAPMKLEDVAIYESVPGWSGSQIDGRYVHDCFLLDKLNAAIRIHRHA